MGVIPMLYIGHPAAAVLLLTQSLSAHDDLVHGDAQDVGNVLLVLVWALRAAERSQLVALPGDDHRRVGLEVEVLLHGEPAKRPSYC